MSRTRRLLLVLMAFILAFCVAGISTLSARTKAAAGTALVYCGYIGGSEDDTGYGIALDGSGNAYITGFTISSEATFPVLVGPNLSYKNYDAFVAKISAYDIPIFTLEPSPTSATVFPWSFLVFLSPLV